MEVASGSEEYTERVIHIQNAREPRERTEPRQRVEEFIYEPSISQIEQNAPERSRRTLPVEPLERIEQFYSTRRRTHPQAPTDKARTRHSKPGEHRPHLIIEESSRHPRKFRPHQSYGPSAEKPTSKPEISVSHPKKRHMGRQYATSPVPSTQNVDQNSNEMLDDYYDGFDDNLLPQTTTMGLSHEYGPEYVTMSFQPPPPPPPRPPRPAMFSGSPPPERFYSRPPRRTSKRTDYIISAPYRTAIWDRAAVWNTKEQKYDILLKLVLTRHGERYSGRNFAYRTGTWTDIVFARKLNQQYHSLKTAEVGIIQKLTAYKKISFVYFIQFHAFPDVRYPETGAWLRTDRRPITFKDNSMTRNSFMNQLLRMCKKKSILYSTLTGKPREHDERPTIRWVSRLDELIEAGAVVDIDVKETFDSTKIYMGLLLAIAVSLGAALGYGFAMENDFSTGFSIASWAITALGFFAAVIAAGEYLGLDSPKATLMDVDGHDRP